ncbi:glycosyltransferase [Thalassococcus sp. BH17M4-6]|uniref:glycosyltransferase n=1 Tax=Thalassococcus sp. BH17M4-6 TaxID=3413148 RepID=UPI003BC9C9B8
MRAPRLDRKNMHLAQAASPRVQPLGRVLMSQGALAPGALVSALAAARTAEAPLDRVVLAEDLASPADVLRAQALHWGAMALDRGATPPDPALADLLPPDLCLAHAILPWTRLGDTLVIATARPELFDDLRQTLPNHLGPVIMALATEADIHAEIAARHAPALCHSAENWVRSDESCRDINALTPGRMALGLAFALLCLGLLALAPTMFFAAVVALATLSLVCAQTLKIAALFASRTPSPTPPPLTDLPRPTVSLLVPLFREENIAGALVKRLERLHYPRARLDVVLILEAADQQTRAALQHAQLPPWMRVVEVPAGQVTTKPRALNYALKFCRGEVIGIYDAEDAPAPDQIERIVTHFSRAPPQVACLQGILDFYNPRANWLSRCFAIEYATWFRILLPGLVRLGFAIPLGGTTVFFRRTALEHVRGWDAHNVTEDADLGMRLARYGYRTEVVATVTREEANNRAWPWIRQRSRWLKGYMMTYLVQMRRPGRLWRDLGARQFLGFQILFLTTILQFTLAPALWSFWLVLFGVWHPLSDLWGPATLAAVLALFLMSEAVSVLLSIAAVARSPHQGLLIWVPTLLLYFPLGIVAAYKALIEMVLKPFYWDKTSHGRSEPDTPGAETPEAE